MVPIIMPASKKSGDQDLLPKIHLGNFSHLLQNSGTIIGNQVQDWTFQRESNPSEIGRVCLEGKVYFLL